jgi:hypothetical protein
MEIGISLAGSALNLFTPKVSLESIYDFEGIKFSPEFRPARPQWPELQPDIHFCKPVIKSDCFKQRKLSRKFTGARHFCYPHQLISHDYIILWPGQLMDSTLSGFSRKLPARCLACTFPPSPISQGRTNGLGQSLPLRRVGGLLKISRNGGLSAAALAPWLMASSAMLGQASTRLVIRNRRQ